MTDDDAIVAIEVRFTAAELRALGVEPDSIPRGGGSNAIRALHGLAPRQRGGTQWEGFAPGSPQNPWKKAVAAKRRRAKKAKGRKGAK